MGSSRPPIQSPIFEFEKRSFVMSLKIDSRPYRHLAMDLIFHCRLFVQAYDQSSNSFIRLRKLLTAADDALKYAADAGNRTSKEVDRKFEEVIHMLSGFENFYSKDPTSESSDPNIGGMEAKTVTSDKFKSASTILNALKQNLHANSMGSEWPTPTRVVRFYLLTSLSDTHPIIVKQVLSNSPSLQEILWNFSRFKDEKQRLTLRENPHFYTELPRSREAYGDRVQISPAENFWHADEFYVLTDKQEPVYIMTDRVLQSFGNFWCPKNAIIFKDICGRLRGEKIVKATLRGTYCGFCRERLPMSVPRTSENYRELWPIITQGYPLTVWECLIGCLPMHGSAGSGQGSGICVCTGRVAPNSSSPVPFPPTSEKPGYNVAYRTHVHLLDNDSLLQLFNHYRLNCEEDWNLRLTWRKLTQVCRRWRYLVFNSSTHLNICLLLTNDSPSINTLSHLPPLPLVIDYSDATKTMAQKDEDNIHLGLRQHGHHVRRVALQASSSSFHAWLKPMNKPFSRLEELSLLSTTTEEINPTLPEALQAPDLCRLSLHGIGLSKGLPLLSSAIALSTLSLTHIGASCYFPPGDLVSQLQGLPRLEELSIGFAIPIPLPDSEGELLPSPTSPVTLATLRRLTFRGVDVYLNNLVAQINSPLLERLSLTLFFDLAFTLGNLTEFIDRTEGLGCLVAGIIFNKDGPSISAGYHEQQDIGKLSLHVYCESLDWQIDSAMQVCSALGKVLSAVEELTLDLNVEGMSSDWENTLDNIMWHELLLPFTGVKKLHIGSSLTVELSQALQPVAGGLVLELLPELQELKVQLDVDDAKNPFSWFVQSRGSVGRPVHLLGPPMSHADRKSFIKYMNNVGKQYQSRAINLIIIYRTFIQAQETTFRLYEELRCVSQTVDYALESATRAQKKRSKEADENFQKAIYALSDYEKKCHSSKTVTQRMAAAKANDKSKLKSRVIVTSVEEPAMTVEVEFLIHRYLLDHSPTIVKLILDPHSDLSEVLWIFSRLKNENKRLALKQNPHFYKWLPTLPEVYGGEFRMDPIETFRHERISVLVDNPKHAGRVFLEAAGKMWTFGNVWVSNGRIIFKDLSGKLVGESIVWEAIQGIPNLWCIEEPPPSLASQPAFLPTDNPNGPSLTSTATQITSAEGMLIRDWREPIRRMLQFHDVNIRITDEPPSSSSRIYSATSS